MMNIKLPGEMFSSEMNDVDPEAIQEIARKTNTVTTVLIIIVAVVFVTFVGYLVYLHSTTKRPKRASGRFEHYQTASAKITSVEEEKYFVSRYERPPEKTEFVSTYVTTSPDELGRTVTYKSKERERENLDIALDSVSKSMNEPKSEPTEKTRYKVRYEFSTDANNLYSGEFTVIEKNDNIAVDKRIDVRYNPENPMMNFTEYNAPVGAM